MTSLARLVLVVFSALSALGVAATPAGAQQKVGLVFSAGPTGGTWTPMAAATAEVVRKRFPDVDVQVEPGAALVNMEKIRNDKADLGWSMTTVMAALTLVAAALLAGVLIYGVLRLYS